VKLRGRPEALDQASRAHNVFRARGADIQAVHGPLQRLLDDATVTNTSSIRCGQLLKRVGIGASMVDAPTCAVEALNFITAS